MWCSLSNSTSERRQCRRPGRLVATARRRLIADQRRQRRRRRRGAGRPAGHRAAARVRRPTEGQGRGGPDEHLFPVRQQRPLPVDDDSAAEPAVESTLVVVVDEVAARSVRTQSGRVVGPAQVGLVLGVARQRAQLGATVRELALVAVLARAVLVERTTQLRLVAAPRRRRPRPIRRCGWLAGAARVRRRTSSSSRRPVLERRREEELGEGETQLVSIVAAEKFGLTSQQLTDRRQLTTR